MSYEFDEKFSFIPSRYFSGQKGLKRVACFKKKVPFRELERSGNRRSPFRGREIGEAHLGVEKGGEAKLREIHLGLVFTFPLKYTMVR